MRACLSCGVWTCSRCGWKRHSANLANPELQNCLRCGSTEGTLRPTMHHDSVWEVCNDQRVPG